jgi:hypothetical protein
MTTPFDLQGQLSIDYSALDGLKPEIDRRVEGVAGTAKVDVDGKGAETALGHLESKSKDTRKEVEKPLKLDADTASVSRKLDEMRSAWGNKWNYAIDQLAERLSKMKVGDSAAGAFDGLLSGRTGLTVGGAMAAGGVATMASIVSGTVEAARADELIKRSTKQVFGDAADEYMVQAEKLADSTGYMTSELLEAQITLNKAAQATKMETSPVEPLTRVATDLAATTGLPQYANDISAVTKAIAAGLQGTSSALLDFGVNLDDAYVLSLSVNAGFKAMGEAITPAQLAQARYNAIMEQTASITGKASETSDDVTRSMMGFDQSMQEAKVAVGQVFLPIVKSLADFVANIPKPLLQAGVWAGLAAGFAMTVAGTVVGIKALVQSIRELGATYASTAATNAVSTATTTAAGGKLAGGMGTLGGKLGVAAIGATILAEGIGALIESLGNKENYYENKYTDMINSIQNEEGGPGWWDLALSSLRLGVTETELNDQWKATGQAKYLDAAFQQWLAQNELLGRGETTRAAIEQFKGLGDVAPTYLDLPGGGINVQPWTYEGLKTWWQKNNMTTVKQAGLDVAVPVSVNLTITDRTAGGVDASSLDAASYEAANR